MRSFNHRTRTNNENIKINNKSDNSSNNQNRRVLNDLTQLNDHNRKSTARDINKSNLKRFDKKIKLDSTLNSDDLIKDHFNKLSSNIDSKVDIHYEDAHKYQDHLITDQEEVNIPSKFTDDIEDEDYDNDFEDIEDDDLEDQENQLELEDMPEDEDERKQQQQQQEALVEESIVPDLVQGSGNAFKPMEPQWNKSIFNELQLVMKKYTRSTLDEDDEDTFDVTMVAEYAPEIFNYLHELENKLMPDPTYMDNQDELKWEMRSVLIDWVVQVHSRFNLLPETLFLTVNYIDRFLSKRKVSLSRFQLVGAVALFIAAKYEEINCPTIQEVAYMADNAYSIDDFLKAERFMIDVLQFDMGWPGPMSFLRRTSKADDYDYETRTLAKYFLEITIMESRFVASQPSWLAAGAHYLSRKILNRGNWTELHVYYSGYTESQLKPLAEVLLQNCQHAEENHKAIFEKYQERRYKRSSTFVQEYFEAVGN